MPIKLEAVSYVYGENTPYRKEALKGINLTINEGDFVGIIGHTGSGKSTLVQHLNGLLHPSTGRVTINGVDAALKTEEAKLMRHKVGMVFQYPEHQLFEETIAQDIAFGPKNLGFSDTEVAQRVREAMDFVGLDYEMYAERSPFQLSGGQMRRVAIAGVVALNPDYLILDEPSAGLDPFGREEIFQKIMELHEKKGITVVLVSHNMEDISRMANRLIVIDDGQIQLDGKPLDIFMNQREKLQAAGVDVPPVSKLIEYLRQRGLPVSQEVISVDDAVKAIEVAVKEVHHVK
ncbi:energy-coupling factor transporter ATPase [Veillonella criceti]|uniref:Energy-coupling factor transporter ATP-binding protein EcfA2 n=1 Tax=Veillonella criceti TaxID=103891 RepID=A0A380NNA4_9FIRM|nr:energy-coupling factor transporter ATPase [Veillonella criceti]SUP44599.1 Energy-coupling factor transporter ATP-binding protein EcfA2 [Veillonella criceti]